MRRLMGLLAVVLVWSLPLRADIIEQILVKVNGEIFTKTDLEQRQVQALRQQNLQFTPADLENDARLQDALLKVTPQILVDVVDELLLVQRGRELGYRLTDDQFKQILENIKKENRIESDAAFEAALDQEGLTMAEFRLQIERQLLVNRVQQTEIMPKLGITEEEAQRYYAEHLDEFRAAATITLREILINAESSRPGEVNVAADEAAREKAERARARALAGEDFAQLAADVSEAPSKANGGLIGPVNRDELAPALLALIEGLKPGDVSEAIRTSRGYQIIKLESASQSEVQPFQEARDLIADKVFAEKQRVEVGRYLERLRSQAIIEWKNDDLKKLYDEQLEARKAAAG